jgi:hypothetical protein
MIDAQAVMSGTGVGSLCSFSRLLLGASGQRASASDRPPHITPNFAPASRNLCGSTASPSRRVS